MQALIGKIKESLSAVLPITGIVLVISVTIAPLTPGTLVLFLFGALLLVLGMGFFSIGVDMSMIPMGDGIGVEISKSRRIAIPLAACFVLGVVVTVAEPDLQVLAQQLPTVPNLQLILAVALGVGVFLALAQARMLLNIPLSYTLIFFYGLVFVLSIFAPKLKYEEGDWEGPLKLGTWRKGGVPSILLCCSCFVSLSVKDFLAVLCFFLSPLITCFAPFHSKSFLN